MMRLGRTRSIPVHFESTPLRAPLRPLGWSVAGLLAVGGCLLAGAGEGPVAELWGPFVACVGGVLATALWQCGRHDLTIGTTRIEAGTGPFRETLATGAIESVEVPPARSWRRLFADREIVLRYTIGDERETALPTRDPASIETVLSSPT